MIRVCYILRMRPDARVQYKRVAYGDKDCIVQLYCNENALLNLDNSYVM
jgi:hypothetical protein